jgi:hypothetical protein
MYSWHDQVANRNGASGIISDVYRAMQTRLDGYRQGAGAIMIGIVAAVFAIDSSFVRSFLDQNLLHDLVNRTDYYFYFLISGALVVIEGVCAIGLIVIHSIGKYFAEMTSIIYKIDEANRVWDPDFWISGAQLYPNKFRIFADSPLKRR